MRLLSALTAHSNSRSRQTGFTLVEILIALALITLLAVGITLSFDGSRSRAQSLISNMTELGAGNVRLKNDMGCYVSAATGLTSPAAAVAHNACGLATSTTWNGPYVGPFTPDQGGNGDAVEMDKIAQGVTIQFTTTIGGSNPFPGGQGTNYIVTASNVPVDVVKQALQECNGQDNPGNGFTGFKCDGTETAPATFMLLYDQTR